MQANVYNTYRFGYPIVSTINDVSSSNLVIQSQSKALAWDSARYNENAENVKMKRLPFFEVNEVLLKPQYLIPNVVQIVDNNNRRRMQAKYNFGLTVAQAALIADSINLNKSTNKVDYGYEIQLRFGLLGGQTEQEDNFPPSVFIRVNGKPVPLPPVIQSNYPGVAPRQPSVPLNITDFVKLRPNLFTCGPPNVISVFWQPDIMDRKWVSSLCLVKKLSSNDLLKKMLEKGNFKSDVTRQLINSKMTAEADDDMALTSLKVSVTCPLGKCRMTLPCRASTCTHLQCFDASLYLQMTEKKPVWNCPVCHKEILYENLAVDGFFVDVLNNLSPTAGNDIEIMPNGSWKSSEDPKEVENSRPAAKVSKPDDDFVLLDDDDMMEVDTNARCVSSSSSKESRPQVPRKDESEKPSTTSTVSQSINNIELICLGDSDDDDTSNGAQGTSSSSTATPRTSINTNILAALNAPLVSNNTVAPTKTAPPLPTATTQGLRWFPKPISSSVGSTVTTTVTTASTTVNAGSRSSVPAAVSRLPSSTTVSSTSSRIHIPLLPKAVPSSSKPTNNKPSNSVYDDDEVICLSD